VVEPGEDSVGPDAEAAAAVLSGRVTRITSLGPLVRLEIEAGGQRWVSLVGYAQQRRQALATGVAVTLTVPAEAVHLIPLREAGATAPH
jgi:hypothetical protein